VRCIVVCDTGPLLHLSEAGAIHLLQQAGEILIPPVVADEFEQNTQGWKPPQWVQIMDLNEPARQKSESWVQARSIDAGESAAIALALQTQADWLLSDDAKARQFAESLGLEVHGSIGLLLWSVAAGYVDERIQALTLLDALANSSLWISERVLREARYAIDKLLSA
jgi:predicted nucleic acid-binding protein